MARPVVLGNGSLTVGLNENGMVHDFYYPYVGLENLTTARSEPHHIGIWIDGDFSWIYGSSWEKIVDFSDEFLISNITYRNEKLQIEIHAKDFVDHHYTVFARNIMIRNLADYRRHIRVFFHQVFQISAQGRADTVMFVPDGNYMLDYKGHCSLLVYAETAEGTPFDQYAAGNAGIEGKRGTFLDAEDGELSMSPVEHGGVDSTIRNSFVVEPRSQQEIHYWLIASDSQNSLVAIHDEFKGRGFIARQEATRQHWIDWLSKANEKMPKNIDIVHARAVRKSLMMIKAHTDKHGGIIASCDSSIYNYGRDYYSYVWPRDGAYVIWPLIRLGYTHEAKAFFKFCKEIRHPDGYMMHKYQPDRAIGSTWHPLVHGKNNELAIQEDETAILLIMLGEYEFYSRDTTFVDSLYADFVQPAANFMARFIDEQTGLPHASYDLWEEKFMTHTYTTATVISGLLVAANIASRNGDTANALIWTSLSEQLTRRSQLFVDQDTGSYNKGLLIDKDSVHTDKTLDVSSFYGMWKFVPTIQTDALKITLVRIERELLGSSPSWGTPRYEQDNYFRPDQKYKGNPWFVTTLWLGQYYASVHRMDDAIKCLDWSLAHALPSGVLSEQVNQETGEIVSVTPLVWSHAELIHLILDMNKN